jgi:transposase-like protein
VNTTRNTETIEVITRDQRRRRWSLVEKSALVQRTYEAGMSVSLVARQEGVAASLLFQWRKLERQGALMAVSAGEAVVPASELAAARAEIAKLQRVLGKGLPGEPVREMLIEAVEKRFGAVEAVPAGHLLQFLSDNGGAYIAHETRHIAMSLGLTPVNTPVCSPQSKDYVSYCTSFAWSGSSAPSSRRRSESLAPCVLRGASSRSGSYRDWFLSL